MSCAKILDIVYEHSGGEMPLIRQIQVALHTLFCPNCAQEIERYEVCRDILREDFFPASPGLENPIMAMITEESQQEENFAVPAGLSTRGWVIAGLVIMVSLLTVFFGMEFSEAAVNAGSSFMLPLGIIIGIVLTSYGALFIGSHLKELSQRFGL